MFEFIQEAEGVDFRGALELLAEKAHVDLPKGGPVGPKVSRDEKDRIKAAYADANTFFVQNLWEKGASEKVLAYILARGMEEPTLREFEVGFAPESRDTLYRALLAKGHSKDDLLASTLVLARDSASQEVVDRFHLRLMFPIANGQGDVIAFGGRVLKKGDQPKYLNSSEHPLYHKGEVLYNLHRAKPFIKEEDLAVFVEGYFDVMASWQAGVHHVVATSGTALTIEQFKLIKRFTTRVALAFDADSAGQEALLRAVHTAQPLGLEVFVITIPEGKDAADAVKANPQVWVDAVAARVPYLDFFFTRLATRFDLASSTGKREFTDAFLDVLKGAPHPVERDHYLKLLSSKVGTPVEMLYDYLGQLSQAVRVSGPKPKKLEIQPKLSRAERLVHYFLGLLLAFPKDFFDAFAALQNFAVFQEKAAAFGLVKRYEKLDAEGFAAFCAHFSEDLERLYPAFPVSSVYKQIEAHYNRSGMVDSTFYEAQEQGNLLRSMAFEAEIQNPDASKVREEIEKMLTLLYFETLSS